MTRTISRNGAARRAGYDTAALTMPESEKAVLAGLLDLLRSDVAAAREIAGTLSASMFTVDHGADVFVAITQALAVDAPQPGDVLAVLRTSYDQAGDDYRNVRQCVVEWLSDGIGLSARLTADAADEVRGSHARRQQAARCSDLLHAIHDTATPPEEIASGIDQLVELRDAGALDAARRSSAVSIVDCLDRWRLNETPPRVPTGFSPIDRNLGGGLPVGISVIAAKPKVGKSCLAGQLMLGALLHDPALTAVWFRGEMSNDQLLCKLLATWSELRHPAVAPITRRQAEDRDTQAAAVSVDLAMQTGGRLSIIPPPITPSLITSTLRAIRPRLVVIDYVQKVQPDAGHSQRVDRRHEIDDTTTRISAAILEFNVSALVVCSLPKMARPEDSIGTLAKDSNLLDYEANVFATLWKQQEDGSTLFRINANRDGPEGDEQLWFDGNAQFFRPAAVQVHEEFSQWSGGGR